MAYEPVDWKNGADGGTPTSAANFNHMDGGIASAHEALQSKANTSDIPDVSAFITADDIPDIPDAPDLSNLVTTSEMNTALEGKANTSDIPEVPAPQFTDDEVQALKALIEGE